MSLRGLLSDRATIQRQVRTTQATGAAALTWTVIAADVPCAVQPAPADQQTIHGRPDVRVGYVVYVLPAAASVVDERDRLLLDDGSEYEVVGISRGRVRNGWPAVLQVREASA